MNIQAKVSKAGTIVKCFGDGQPDCNCEGCFNKKMLENNEVKHTKETFRMKIPFVCPLLTCDYCGYKFILHGIAFSGDRHFDNRNDQVLQQDTFYYCPYCGRKNE